MQAIHKALTNRPSYGKSPYWIQIGGGSVLAADELADKSRVPGTGSDIVYDNLSGIEAIRSLIKRHPSRVVDNYMLSVAESTPHVRTAYVPAPNIYGPGRGTGNQRSVQMPELAKVTLKREKGLQVGKGLSTWGNVHVRDLSRLLVLLVERAVKGDEDDRVWGENGIYHVATGEMVSHLHLFFLKRPATNLLTSPSQSFGEVSRRVVEAARDLKLVPSKDVETVSGEEADKLLPHGSILFGTNARSRPRREDILGWKQQEKGLEHEIPRVVATEAQALGLLAGKAPAARL